MGLTTRTGTWHPQTTRQFAAVLMPHLRFADSLPYLRGLARQLGLQEIRVVSQTIRQDQAQTIPGLYACLGTP